MTYYVMSYPRDGCADHINVNAPFESLETARAFVRDELGIDTTDQSLWWAGIDDEHGDTVAVEAWNENHNEGCGGVQIVRDA